MVTIQEGRLTATQLWQLIHDLGPKVDRRTVFDPSYVHEFERRGLFCPLYSWAVPSEEAVHAIAEFVGSDKLLEVGAGSGLWAALLQDIGVQVTATDKATVSNKWATARYTDIQRIGAVSAVKQHMDCNVLMLCWPPYNDKMAYQALRAFRGDKVVYIGEGRWGCNAEDKFFGELDKNWELSEEVFIPQWPGIHDYLELYTRKI